jgi:4-diphosphocytidyl-2-C-methyl-D-erythritol kinase
MSVRVFAPAKINLTLQVGRPSADGMHPVQSVVMFADVGDWVTTASAADLTLQINGPFGGDLDPGDNLVLVAARALMLQARCEQGAALTLEKHLPIASGIGGGSSDAAAALKALNALWRTGLSEDELTAFARAIGADAPVCVRAQSAWMTGVGEIVAPLQVPPLPAVLVNPRRPLPTAQVFRRFDEMGGGDAFSPAAAPRWRTAHEAVASAAAMGNDLAAAARSLMPDIGVIEDALRADPRALYVALSGSGATVFAIVANKSDAAALAADLADRRPGWWIAPTTLGTLDAASAAP